MACKAKSTASTAGMNAQANASVRIANVFEYLMRFYASHLGSGLWGLYDGGVMSWLATDLSENEAKQQAADRNVIFDQWGQRRKTSAGRSNRHPGGVCDVGPGGELDYWVREKAEWWGRVRGPDGHHVWIKAADLRPAKECG